MIPAKALAANGSRPLAARCGTPGWRRSCPAGALRGCRCCAVATAGAHRCPPTPGCRSPDHPAAVRSAAGSHRCSAPCMFSDRPRVVQVPADANSATGPGASSSNEAVTEVPSKRATTARATAPSGTAGARATKASAVSQRDLPRNPAVTRRLKALEGGQDGQHSGTTAHCRGKATSGPL